MPTQILCFRFLRGGSAWAGRQLQHGRVLPFAQLSQQDYLAIRKLERVMMNFALALVDLPKPGHLVRDLTFRVPKVDGVVLHLSRRRVPYREASIRPRFALGQKRSRE